ncbi:hypothetical protein [Mycolicibacterium anyangense]|uniref:hypothetical protein n=1 Tax=Mycolicibacterium anyangense TaxID=1431246 RepID=UPI0013D54983|nr:hypothetical protein [Mycolicibacterium anyangense]
MRSDIDPLEAVRMLSTSLYHDVFFDDSPARPEYVTQVLDIFIRGIAADSPTRPTSHSAHRIPAVDPRTAMRRDYRQRVDMAEEAEQVRLREAAEDAQRERAWIRTREALDELAPEVVAECGRRHFAAKRLGRLTTDRGWVFRLCAAHPPGEADTCMRVAFHPDGTWTLLGGEAGAGTRPVDKNATFHPGRRQGFVFDGYRHEAEVVVTLSRDALRDRILAQLPQPGGL